MNPSLKALGIDRLGIDERLSLVEEIWDSIAAENAAIPLTDAQRQELLARMKEDDAMPEAVTDWETVKAGSLSRLKT